MFKKVLALVLAGCMAAGVLTACNSETVSSGASSQAAAGSAASKAETASTAEGGLPIVEEPITLRVLSETRAEIIQGNDMPIFQELEKRTNIHLEWELLPIDGQERITKFNVIMASGDIPDLVHCSLINDVNKYGQQGLFLGLKDLINEHAPNMAETFNDPFPDSEVPYEINVWSEITAKDGEIYNVPYVSANNSIGAVWSIRTDWLEAVDMEVPTTADELYEVLKAFKEQDPNGNGEADEIPFGSSNGQKSTNIMPIVNAFDGHMDLYIDAEDDTVKYGPVEPGYKEGLEFLNKLYSEGLLEEDYVSATRDQWLARAGGNQQGLMFGWPGSGIGMANGELQKLDENYHFEPIKPFVSPSGKQYKDTKMSGMLVSPRTAVSANTEYPVEIIRYLDYCFSEEGKILSKFGLEGEHYTIEDGEPKYTDYILNNSEGLDPETVRIRLGVNWQLLPYYSDWPGEYQAMEKNAPWTVAAWDTYKQPGLLEAPFPSLGLTEDEISRRASILAEIETYRDPMIDKFIMGTESLDNYDAFVENINRAGLQELLTMLNEAYDAYKANK